MRSLDAFWSKVNIAGPDECWTWKAGLYRDGYGQLGYRDASGRQHTIRAHAFALILATGEDQRGRFALHRCDNPPCCNPDHLYWGDQKQNAADMRERGRAKQPAPRKGVENPRAVLTEDEVRELRHLYATGDVTQQELADYYAVSQQIISYAVRRHTWSHIE